MSYNYNENLSLTLTISWSPFSKPLTWKLVPFHRQNVSMTGLTQVEPT